MNIGQSSTKKMCGVRSRVNIGQSSTIKMKLCPKPSEHRTR
ncbi:hypothetical protein JOC76_001926 [Neobacillus cucumis]|nr:hypothetical protein [Neobacillus cucumis]